MLKVEKRKGFWTAHVTGRPSKDLRTALLSLAAQLAKADTRLLAIVGDDPCGGRDCDTCEIGGCEPESAAQDFAADAEIQFAASGGLQPEDLENWLTPLPPGALGETADFEAADDGQPDEAQEWHDYDPDC